MVAVLNEEEKEVPKIRGGEEEAFCLKDSLRNLILIQIGLFSQATSRSPPPHERSINEFLERIRIRTTTTTSF